MTKFEELLSQINREHVYIQTHNFPDPDAIASAYGMQRLLEERGISATICYKGKIDRYSTGKLLDMVGIELLEVDDLKSIMSEDDEVILVDSQKGNSNIVDIPGDEIICVDHHPNNDMFQYRFTDIRPQIGACSTIIAQYFFENNAHMDWKIATALTYGIRIDTNKLARGVSKLDMEMLYRMYDLTDGDIIRTLEHSNLCFEDLIAYSSAISSIEVYDNIGFADTGRDCPEALIANVSDFILAIMEVSFSVVYSRRDNGIKISARSEGDVLDAGKITAEALEGIGNGGGHAEMAGGFVPFEGSEQQEVILTDQIKERFSNTVSQALAKTLDNDKA